MIPGIAPAIITRAGGGGSGVQLVSSYAQALSDSTIDLTSASPLAEPGDLLLITVGFASNTSVTYTAPDGWTDLLFAGAAGGNRSSYTGGIWMIVDSTVPASINLSTNSQMAIAGVFLLRGVSSSSPLDYFSLEWSTTSLPPPYAFPEYQENSLLIYTGVFSLTSHPTNPETHLQVTPPGDLASHQQNAASGSRFSLFSAEIYQEWMDGAPWLSESSHELTINLRFSAMAVRVNPA